MVRVSFLADIFIFNQPGLAGPLKLEPLSDAFRGLIVFSAPYRE